MTRMRTIDLGSAILFLYGCSGSGGGSADAPNPSTGGIGGRAAVSLSAAGIAGAYASGMDQSLGGRELNTTASAGQTSGDKLERGDAGTGNWVTNGGADDGTLERAGAGGAPSAAGDTSTWASFAGRSLITSAGASGASGSLGTPIGGNYHSGGITTGGTPTTVIASGGVASGGVASGGVASTSGSVGNGGAIAVGGTSGSLSNCIIAGIGYAANTVNPNDACQTCQPSVAVTNWSPRAEGESCGPRSYCAAGACTKGCLIASKFYTQGTVNPASECEVCDTTGPVGTWSMVSGKTCGPVLAAGDYHTCALINGGVRCWGGNGSRQLGAGITDGHSAQPLQVVGLDKDVTAIAAGANQTCALINGGVLCWGTVGDVVTRTAGVFDSPTPTPVPELTTGVTAIAVGKYHACAIVGGAAKCWGSNDRGQLGTGDNSYPNVPVQVKGLTANVTSIAAGVDFGCAAVRRSSYHDIYCWGENSKYQLGTETYLMYRTPTMVSLTYGTVTGLAAGDGHTCAILDGAAYCWGYNWRGQLGTSPTKGISSKPILVQDAGAGVTSISAGFYHTCAVINDAGKCWGMNDSGELGTANAPALSDIPAAPYGLTGTATSVAAGYAHSCLTVNREVYCAGANNSGQLGTGNTTSSTIPVKVLLQ